MSSRDVRARFQDVAPALYGYAHALSRDGDVARELVHDCALRAFTAGRVPEDDKAFKAWAFTILRNIFIDRQRKIRAAPFVYDTDETDTVSIAPNIEDSMVNAAAVRQALEAMTDAHREVLILIDVQGFTQAEAAEILEVPVGTVMSRISRARAAMLDVISRGNVVSLRRRGRG